MDYLDDMAKHGVCVIKNMLDADTLSTLTAEVKKIRDQVTAKIATMDRPLKKHTDITERYLNRLDFRCGFAAEIFDRVAAPISQIIKKMSPTINFKHYWGAIPAMMSGPTNLHRDVYPLLNTIENQNLGSIDVGLPPYYFTVLLPLVKITTENGPTEFVKGSNHLKMVDETAAEIYAPLPSPGDVIIFDGRTLHRGAANKTQEERLVAYITYTAEWYYDQTFVVNKYLFPELMDSVS